MNGPPGRSPSENPVAAALFRQMESASRADANPFRRGAAGELVSLLGARFPEAAVLGSLSVPFDGEGWISAAALGEIAETAERHGAGLVELQPRDNRAFIPGTASDPSQGRRPAPRASSRPWTRATVSLCPFWGPCLGREARRTSVFRDLFAVLAREGREGFATGLAGCARDCRRVVERSDLAALPEGIGGDLSLWIGGRHRPFRRPVTPVPWRIFPADFPGDLADFVLKVQALSDSLARREETFPELAARLGLDRVEDFLGARPQAPPGAGPEPAGEGGPRGHPALPGGEAEPEG